MTEIMLAPEFIPLLESGVKTQTIRLGRRDYPLGPATFNIEGNIHPIKIASITYKTVADLTTDDAVRDGFDDLDALTAALTKFYPDHSAQSEVTLIAFVDPD